MIWQKKIKPQLRTRLAGLALLALAILVTIGIWFARPAVSTPPVPASGHLIAIVDDPLETPHVLEQLNRLGIPVENSIPEIGLVLIRAPDKPSVLTQVTGVAKWEAPVELTPQGQVSAVSPTQAGGCADSWALDLVGVRNLGKDAGKGITIAIVDTGVAPHSALRSHLVKGYDVVQHAIYMGSDEDASFHGTHVAGIAAGDGNGGVCGVAPGASIMPVRVFPVGSNAASSWDVAEGIVWAANNGARVINLSLGSPFPAPEHEARALQYARQRAVVAAAGGNCGSSCRRFWPAADATLGVGAITETRVRAPFSAIGDHISIVAPGVNIPSALPHDQVGMLSGTSMATPFVSGAAAVLLADAPWLSTDQVGNMLRQSATNVGAPGQNSEIGSGLLNVDAGVALAQRSARARATPTPRSAFPTPTAPSGARPAPGPGITPTPYGTYWFVPMRKSLGRWFQDLGDWLQQ